tara:strand:- start:576 stop:1064 length:489 start_codon:yes stop_codon:yes gene_type:complete
MLIIALLTTALSQGGAQPPMQDGAIACDRNGNTLELNACGVLDLEREQARMQRYLEAAYSRARDSDFADPSYGEPTQSTAYLQAAQAAWVAYADIRCLGLYDQWKGGTIRTLIGLGCRIEATRQRTHDIWSDHLTYPDSTPPVLPEPLVSVAADEAAGRTGP